VFLSIPIAGMIAAWCKNGFYAIRSALVLAAADPEGLTGLSFIRHFPTDIQISVKDFLELLNELSYIAG